MGRGVGIRVGLMVLTLGGGCDEPSEIGKLAGEYCDADEPCAKSLVCARDNVCRYPTEPGTLPVDAPCLSSAQCALDLVCAGNGTCQPDGGPGTAAFGETCSVTTDCVFGLACLDGTCRGFEIPFWIGDTCPLEDEPGAFRMLFEVPDGPVTADFYRLPFPNDARVDAAGRIQLSDHPKPGALIDLLGDVVGDLTLAIQGQVDGFGPNQAVLMRFSTFPDQGTLDLGTPGTPLFTSGGPTIGIFDLTPGSESTVTVPAAFSGSTGRGQYICKNWVGIHPLDGRPLEPGHTYAVLLTTEVRNGAGAALTRDADFDAMLAGGAPGDARLARAWEAYQPLRDWIESQGVDRARIAGGTVFTVADTTREPTLLREAVVAAPVPTLSSAVVCGTADPFADPDDDKRGCQAPSDLFTEIQGLVSLPQFQRGTPPFKNPDDGGAIDFSAGAPAPVRTAQVHVTITVPKGVDMPEDGWPVVLYAHGSGGAYTSVISTGFAADHTLLDPGTPVAYAMVGFDAPMAGPRRSLDTYPADKQAKWLGVDPDAFDEDVLFFNPFNFPAARGNVLQEVADIWSMVRFIQAYDEEAGPAGVPLDFDTTKLVFVGHSQGGVTGAVALGYDDQIDAAVLSGAGGLTIQSLLNKTSPKDVPAAIRVALVDPDISRVHPILNLAQMLSETADGVNHGRFVVREPREGLTPKHVLQIVGRGDTYSPVATQAPLARSLGLGRLDLAPEVLQQAMVPVSVPVQGNVGGTTGVAVSYAPAQGRDGHFVMFEVQAATDHVSSFLGTLVSDDVPIVE